jgi:HlyD family secretion protein
MRWTWIILLIVAAAGAAFWLTRGRGIPVDAARVRRGPIQEYVEEEGKTRLAETYVLSMPFNGRVAAIPHVEGTLVRRGQVVAQLVPLDLELNVAVATAAVDRLKAAVRESQDVTVESTSLQQALSFVESMDRTVDAATNRVRSGEAKRDYAEKHLARMQRLFSENARSEDDLDRARVLHVESSVDYQQDVLVQRAMEAMQAATALMPTTVRQYIARKTLSTEVLEKQLAEAEVLLRQARRDQGRGSLSSPIDGVVLERLSSNEGQLAAGTPLLKLGRWEDLELEADLLSQEVVRVKIGNLVEVSGPAIGPLPAQATVTRIYPAGFTKVSSLGVEQQRVKVVMKLADEHWQRLRQAQQLGVEYRVRVRVFTAHRDQALVVPRSALFRSAAGQWQLFAIRQGKAELVDVTIGLANDAWVELAKGLAADELVVLAPETHLRDGQAVRLPENFP